MQVIGQDKLFAIYAGPIFAGGDSPANNNSNAIVQATSKYINSADFKNAF